MQTRSPAPRRLHVALVALALILAHPFSARQADCPRELDSTSSFSRLLDRAYELHERGCRPAVRVLTDRLMGLAEVDHGARSLEMADVLDLHVENLFSLGERDAAAIELACEGLSIRRAHAPSRPYGLARSHLNLGALLGARVNAPSPAFAACRDLGVFLRPRTGWNRAQEAWEQLDEARGLWERSVGVESVEVADLLTYVVELIEDWQTEGRDWASRQAWILELQDPETPAGKSVLETLEEMRIGGIDAGVLASDPALAVALRSVALGHAADSESPEYAEAVNVLGKVLHQRRLYDETLAVFDRALQLRIRVHPPGHPQIARAYHNRGETLMLVGKLEEARPDLETAYRMRLALGGERYRGAVATSLQMLAKLHFFTGDLQAAVALYRDALPRLEKTYGGFYYVEGLVGLGEVYEALGESDEAERLYRQALKELEKPPAHGDDTPAPSRKIAAIRAKLGSLLAARGQRETAEVLLTEALRVQESLPVRPLEDYAETLYGLGKIAEARHDANAALKFFEASADALASYRGTHPGIIDVLLEKAKAEVDAGRLDLAGETLDRVAVELPRLGDSAYGARARERLLRARVLASTGRRDAALAEATLAARLFARHLGPAYRLLPPDRALSYALQNRESLELALALLAESTPSREAIASGWEVLALNRGSVVDELEQRYGWARREADPELRRLLDELREARRHLASTQVRVRRASTMHEQSVLLRYANTRVRVAERALAERSAGLRLEIPGTALEFSELMAHLPQESALAAFVKIGASSDLRRAARYGVFVRAAGGAELDFIDLGPADEIDRRIERWRAELLAVDGPWDEMEARLRVEGLHLRELLWNPVTRSAGATRRFLVVPDGSIFLLPLAALPGTADGTYLIEEGYEVHYLVAERDLVARRGSAVPPESLLVIGSPDFDAADPERQVVRADLSSRPSFTERIRDTASELFRDFLRDPCLGERNPYFLPLPQTRREAHEIESIFTESHLRRKREPKVSKLVSAEATETAFKLEAPAHSVLHVATHGFFDLHCGEVTASRGLSDELIDAPGERRVVPGLAFAGANRRRDVSDDDDGILTVPEIASLDLSAADWVVLSACETGIGRAAAGEGVSGLARAFRVAGAGTLILSLWSVEDQATREWMIELYRARFSNAESTASCLRTASLEILERRRRAGETTHPYFWAAFVATGGWE